MNSSVRVCHRLTLAGGGGKSGKDFQLPVVLRLEQKEMSKKKGEFLVCGVQTSCLAEPGLMLMKCLLLTLQVLAYR